MASPQTTKPASGLSAEPVSGSEFLSGSKLSSDTQLPARRQAQVCQFRLSVSPSMAWAVAPLVAHRLAESDSAYPNLQLNNRWRVIACRDEIQWILQCRVRPD